LTLRLIAFRHTGNLNLTNAFGIFSFSSRQQRRFLVIDEAQFILVEPDTTKLGWGVVKFVARLQVRIHSYPHLSFHQIKAKVVFCDKGFLFSLSPLSVTQKKLLREQNCCEEGTKKSLLQFFSVSFLIVLLLPFVFLFSRETKVLQFVIAKYPHLSIIINDCNTNIS